MLDKGKAIWSVILLVTIWVAGLLVLIAIGRLISFLPRSTSDICCVGAFILFLVFMLPSIRDQVKVRGVVHFLPSLVLLVGFLVIALFWFGFYKLVCYLISQASAWF